MSKGPIAALLILTAISGCANAHGRAHTSHPRPTPVSTGKATLSDLDLLHQAEQILVRDCMARRNLEYRPIPRTQVPDMESFPYVVDDVKWAQRNGYGRAERQALDKAAGSSTRYYRTFSGAQRQTWLIAYHGDRSSPLTARLPTGGTIGHSGNGCAAQAWQELYGDKRQWFRAARITQTLDNLRVTQTQGDPEYRAALERWQKCMSGEGFSAPTPLALRSRSLAYRGKDAEARDIRAATAEARCAASSGLSRTAHELDAANAAALDQRNRAEFETAERLRASALPKARALVGAR
ncbi:hypothetical protein [Spongiactinospora sp. TRM90649]|uniref:hypothetical protein n=1 Tax=Spongiactinospora sp. TRM90649 TaxID=3031114 RepID=UPI0023F949E3|nr:hypothetical protein [Spongiactinospora sp. TRM90649]MDF5751250.1 hypothetical protein [Spongiactinospora sp. TRM90649]